MMEKVNKIMEVILLIFIIMDLLFCVAGLQKQLNPERKDYISFNEISDVEKADDGTITIISTDGNVYTINTQKGEQ